jgi:tRNA/rRNA methyltransferase
VIHIPIHCILVRSMHSRNVGSCSRAMANGGADRLILIDPKCEIVNLDSRQGAAGAQRRLMEATVYKSWKDFYESEPDGIRVAFSARDKKETDWLSFQDRSDNILEEYMKPQQNSDGQQPVRPLYFVFGPEDHGLENDDFLYIHHICQLPTNGDYPSFNLSHAVLSALLLFHECARRKNVQIKTESNSPKPLTDSSAATVHMDAADKFVFPEKALKNWLNEIGFTLGDRRVDVYTVMRRMLLNNRATQKELRILEAVVFQTIRKLNDK